MSTLERDRDALMPQGMDHDGQVCWWVLGTIGSINADVAGTPLVITSDEVRDWDDDDWDNVNALTPQISGSVSASERARVVETLVELERADIGQDDRWWDR